jgi:toxin ParE1/3/4
VASVRWTTVAVRELRGIVEKLSALSATSGPRLASRIFDASDSLEAFPRFGRRVPEFQHDAIRELIVGDYRLIYRLVSDEEVWILTVMHGSRDLLRHLPAGPWDIE